MRRFWRLCPLVALALAASPGASAITVFDPSNYAQNILQASRALEQIHNQIREIEQQAEMLAHNPLQLSPELSQSISDARQLFTSAEGLAFEVDRLSDAVRALYPDTWRNFDLAGIGSRTDRWLSEDRSALQHAMEAEAQAAHEIESAQGRIGRALQSSADAQGQTGAVQASNQLLGIEAAQLAQIQALMTAESRALSEERMERVAREQRAVEIARRAFPIESNATLTPARSAFDH